MDEADVSDDLASILLTEKEIQAKVSELAAAIDADYEGQELLLVGVLKGALLSVNPEARLVDITHDIPPQDVREGARVLAAARTFFPAGTKVKPFILRRPPRSWVGCRVEGSSLNSPLLPPTSVLNTIM